MFDKRAWTTVAVGVAMGLSLVASASERAPFTAKKMDNEMELIVVEDHKVPLATIVLVFKAGAMTETKDINGLTHLWEHMFFKGNATLPDQEAFDRRIRQLGIVFNGDTSAEKVRYYFTLPSANLNDGIKFMYDAIATPNLDVKELERERVVVLNEYDRNAAQPSFDLQRLTRYLIYGDKQHLRDPLGDRKVIDTATRDQLIRIKAEVFQPSNAALMISGDVDSKAVEAEVQKVFKDWRTPKGWKRPSYGPYPKFAETIAFNMTRPNVQNAQVSLRFNGPNVSEHEKDTFTADLFITMLGARSGRFYKTLIDSGLCAGAGVYYPTQSETSELMAYAVTTAENVPKVRALLKEELIAMQKADYFTEQQLTDVKRAMTIEHKRELNQPSEFVKTLAFWWSVAGLDYYNAYFDKLKGNSLKDLNSFAKTWLDPKLPHVDSVLLSPEGAKSIGMTDDSTALMKKHLGI
jgi:zinc protease